MNYPPVQKESWQERAIRARQQYADRSIDDDVDNPLNAPLEAKPPFAHSGRWFIWYSQFLPLKFKYCNVVIFLKMVIDVKKMFVLEVIYVLIIYKWLALTH
jgi:hypothetical protein